MGSTSAVEVEGAVDTFRFVVLSVRRRLSVSLSLSLSFLVAASADCCLSLFFFLFFLSLLFFSLLSSAAGGSSHISFFFLWGSPHVSTRAPSPHTGGTEWIVFRRTMPLSDCAVISTLTPQLRLKHVLEPKTKKRRAEHKPEWTELRNQLSTQRHENMKFHLFTNGKDFSIWKTLKRRRTSIIVFPGLFTAIF